MGDAMLPEHFDAPLDGVTLGDATQIDAHTLLHEADGAIVPIGFHQPVIQSRQLFQNRIFVGPAAFPEIVVLPDTVVSDVERAPGQQRNIQSAKNQRKKFIADFDRSARRLPIDPGHFTVLDIGTHQVVDASNFCEHSGHRLLSSFQIVVPDVNADLRAHVRLCLSNPLGEGRS